MILNMFNVASFLLNATMSAHSGVLHQSINEASTYLTRPINDDASNKTTS